MSLSTKLHDEYREVNRRVQNAVKKGTSDWIDTQCEENEPCLNKNSCKRGAYQPKDLTSERQARSSTIQDRSGQCLTEQQEMF